MGATGTGRERLLQAGVQQISAGGTELTRRLFTADDLCARAGVARRTFYHYFATVEEFAAALGVEQQAAASLDGEDVLAGNLGDLRQAVEHLVRAELDDLAVDGSERARLLFALLDRATPVVVWPNRWALLINDVARLGRSLPASIDASTVGAHFAGIVAGAALAGTVDVGSIASTITSALAAMTQPDEVDGASGAGEALVIEVRQRWREERGELAVTNIRRLVLEAAAAEIGARGFDSCSMDVLADRTGLSTRAIKRFVGSRLDIAAGLVEEVVPSLVMALERDASTHEAGDVLHRHIVRVAQLIRERPEVGDLDRVVRDAQRRTGADPAPAYIEQLDRAVARVIAAEFTGVSRDAALQAARTAADSTATLTAAGVDPELCASAVVATLSALLC